MPPIVCPSCKSTNPGDAQFCFFDGSNLRAHHVGGDNVPAFNKMPRDFTFPSGRHCRTFDDFVMGCQEDWDNARELLRQGVLGQFFQGAGRQDLARVAQQSLGQPDLDVALTTFLDALPVVNRKGPKLDLEPRRVLLGNVPAGERREATVVISNQGKGMLAGSVSVSDGGQWLRLGGSNNGQCSVKTTGEQKLLVQVDTRGLPAGQSYGGKLTVITNGGVAEVPVRVDLAAMPFTGGAFKGVRSQRELAERMKAKPKEAVPLLESGEIAKWFAANGWNFPIQGTPAKGVAGVQQFFEMMGLSKPPPVQVTPAEVRLSGNYPQPIRGQVLLQTSGKRWVYANVVSSVPWLRVLTPSVSGAKEAPITFEVDSRQVPRGRAPEGELKVIANGGQKLTVKVQAVVTGIKGPSQLTGMLRPLLTCVLAFFLLRLVLAPLIDGYARGAATHAAAERVASVAPAAKFGEFGGWLQLPWAPTLLDTDAAALDEFLGPPAPGTQANQARVRDFRDYFSGYFVRILTLWTWWLGALLGAGVVLRRGGNWLDVPWGLIAGAVAGVAVSATLGCLILVGDLVPHFLWDITLRSQGGGAGLLILWMMLAVFCWTLLGALVGLALTLLGPLGQVLLVPIQTPVAGLFRLAGLRGVAAYFEG